MDFPEMIQAMVMSERIALLKEQTVSSQRYMSVEQARIITRIYRENISSPSSQKRAKALAASLDEMPIALDPQELIVGNRTPGIRAGVVFP